MTPQTILITGATSGIGRDAALRLAELGHRVIATGRRPAALTTLAEEARGAGLSLDTVRVDVNDQATIDAAVAEVDALTGGHGVDVLVNNAGFGLIGPVTEMSDADVRAQFDTNVFGLLAVTRAFVPKMRSRRSGRILNVTSGAGRAAFPFFGPYAATKFAVEALSDALRYELGGFGIDVVLIEPGMTRTGFADHALSKVAGYGGEGAPYRDVLARVDAMTARSDRMSVDPEVITKAIVRAIDARRPAARYMAPFRMKLTIAALRLLPTPLVDLAMRKVFGLDAKSLRDAPTPTAPSESAAPQRASA